MRTFGIKIPLPLGYVEESSRGPDLLCSVTGFSTNYDDDPLFLDRVEGFHTAVLQHLPSSVADQTPAARGILAVVGKDGSCDVHIDASMVLATHVKSPVSPDDAVTRDQIFDIERLEFPGITIPSDAGIFCLLTHNWRRGLFYDLKPVVDGQPKRAFDIAERLAACFSKLLFAELYRIGPGEWEKFFAQSWFPFSVLSQGTQKQMLAYIRGGWSIDELLETIAEELDPHLDDLAGNSPIFQPHADIIATAVRHYRGGDFLSASSMLYPRIEGILRTYRNTASLGGTKQAALASTVGEVVSGSSALLPDRFQDYLNEIYFKDFDPKAPQGVSRHTVSHGMTPTEDFDKKSAVLGLLIARQLRLYLRLPD